MALIAPSVIEEIKQLSIVDIISSYMELTRRGNLLVGLCPFHMEKTPSFTVFENRNNYKCYGCQAYGDSIKFIQDYKGLDFHNAVVFICENYGIELKYDGGKEHKSLAVHKELHERVANFAKEQLYSKYGKKAFDYLNSRGFSKELLEYFDIGFLSPDVSMSAIIKEFPKDVLKESGIFVDTKYGFKSFFENRILFPLRSYTGAYIGFSGRTMDPAERAKYKNSPETALFSKRRELFNLHNAKDTMIKSKRCYIVEGYFDVMRMVEAGYSESVAIMGTAFTKEQVGRLKTYVEEYNIILDGDAAGVKAMRDSLLVALAADIYPYVAFLPSGEDPDTYIQKNSKENFDVLLSNREDLLLYTIKEERSQATDANRKFHRLESVKQMLGNIKNIYRKQHYTTKTSEIFGVDINTLSGEIVPSIEKAVVKKNGLKTIAYHCEKDFVSALMQLTDEQAFKLVMDMVPEFFYDSPSRDLFKKIVELFAQSGSISSLMSDTELSPEMVDIVFRPSGQNNAYDTAVENKLKIIYNNTMREYHDLQDKLRNEKDPVIEAQLIKNLQAVLARRNQLNKQLNLG